MIEGFLFEMKLHFSNWRYCITTLTIL